MRHHNLTDKTLDTSYVASLKAALKASKVRPVVLDIVTTHGPITHDELIEKYQQRVLFDNTIPRASDSGIRTRLRELVQAGFVFQFDAGGSSKFGNPAKRWAAVSSTAFTHNQRKKALIQQQMLARSENDEDLIPVTSISTLLRELNATQPNPSNPNNANSPSNTNSPAAPTGEPNA